MIPLNHIRAAGKTTKNSLQALGVLIHREELVHLLWSASLLIYSHALKMSIQSADLTYFSLWIFFSAILLQSGNSIKIIFYYKNLNHHHKSQHNIALLSPHNKPAFPYPVGILWAMNTVCISRTDATMYKTTTCLSSLHINRYPWDFLQEGWHSRFRKFLL